jgi:hypothetical protein
MPKYKASLIIKADNGARLETMTIIIEANNAIHAKEILRDQYGEEAVRSVVRDDAAPKAFKSRL